MNSLMSMRTIAAASSNRNSASARASSVLPTPVGPKEQERAERPVGILQAGARAADGGGDRLDRFGLPDHALADLRLHREQLLALAGQHLLDRHARSSG